MALALDRARRAAECGEVPVAAVIVDSRGILLACEENRMVRDKDPTAHAELLVIRAAIRNSGRARLIDCDLYTTLEPCAMCAGAITCARLRRLYFGAFDSKSGAVENGPCLFDSETCHHRPEVLGGMRETESQRLLTNFFRERRKPALDFFPATE